MAKRAARGIRTGAPPQEPDTVITGQELARTMQQVASVALLPVVEWTSWPACDEHQHDAVLSTGYRGKMVRD
jgi:hypothetical protein